MVIDSYKTVYTACRFRYASRKTKRYIIKTKTSGGTATLRLYYWGTPPLTKCSRFEELEIRLLPLPVFTTGTNRCVALSKTSNVNIKGLNFSAELVSLGGLNQVLSHRYRIGAPIPYKASETSLQILVKLFGNHYAPSH